MDVMDLASVGDSIMHRLLTATPTDGSEEVRSKAIDRPVRKP